MSCDLYKSRSSSLCNISNRSPTSPLLGPNIFLAQVVFRHFLFIFFPQSKWSWFTSKRNCFVYYNFQFSICYWFAREQQQARTIWCQSTKLGHSGTHCRCSTPLKQVGVESATSWRPLQEAVTPLLSAPVSTVSCNTVDHVATCFSNQTPTPLTLSADTGRSYLIYIRIWREMKPLQPGRMDSGTLSALEFSQQIIFLTKKERKYYTSKSYPPPHCNKHTHMWICLILTASGHSQLGSLPLLRK
jgi:hypothetical protein